MIRIEVLILFLLFFSRVEAQFTGGVSSLSAKAFITQKECPANASLKIFNGGGGDGSSYFTYVNPLACNNIKTYYKLNETPTLAYATSNKDKELNFFYKEEYKSGSINFKIYDYKKNFISGSIPKNIGDNFLSLKLEGLKFSDNSSLIKGSVYTLEVLGEKSDKYYLTFKYQEYEVHE